MAPGRQIGKILFEVPLKFPPGPSKHPSVPEIKAKLSGHSNPLLLQLEAELDLCPDVRGKLESVPVVLATAEAPRIAESLGQSLHLDVRRRCFVTERSGIVVELIVDRDGHEGDGRWEDHVLGRLSEVIRRHGVTSVAVADLGHPDAWLSLQASP